MEEPEWNLSIADYFFSDKMSGRRVYLSLDDETLEEIGRAHSVTEPVADFETAVASHASRGSGAFGYWSSVYMQWKRADAPRATPPFIGFLAATTLAAARMRTGRFGGKPNFYLELASLLGDPSGQQAIQEPFRTLAPVLWNALVTWLEVDQAGQRGMPVVQPTTTHDQYISYSTSQVIMRGVDRDRLPEFFAAIGAIGGEEIDPDELLARFVEWSRLGNRLTTRMSQALSEKDSRGLIATTLAAELASWDGSLVDSRGKPIVRLVPRYDAMRRDLSWVLKVPVDLGPMRIQVLGEQLNLDEQSRFYKCPEGLAARLRDIGSLDAGPVRLRVDARQLIPLGIDYAAGGYVAVERVEIGEEYVVLVADTLFDKVQFFLDRSAALRPKKLSGAPEGWNLVGLVRFEEIPTATDADLAALIPNAQRLAMFSGGLRVSSGAFRYLVGGEPDLEASPVSGHELQIAVDGAVIATAHAQHVRVPLSGLRLTPGEHAVDVGSYSRRFDLLERLQEPPPGAPSLAHSLLTVEGGFAATAALERPDKFSDVWISGAYIEALDPSVLAPAREHSPMIPWTGERQVAFGQPGDTCEIPLRPPAWTAALEIPPNAYELDEAEEDCGFRFLWIVRCFAHGFELVPIHEDPIDALVPERGADTWTKELRSCASSIRNLLSLPSEIQQRWRTYCEQGGVEQDV